MQVTETLSSGLKREYKVVVPAAELDKQLTDRLAGMAKTANIRGFRPGKVPVGHLRRVYGKQAMAEVVQKAIDDQSRAILAERNLKPAYQPEVSLPQDQKEVDAIIDGKGDLAFSVALEVIPDFELKDHGGLELTRHVADVSDAQINETLERLASQNKNYEDKAGAAETGDRVVIDFVGKMDGKAFDGGTATEVPLEIGSNQFIPGFEDQLVGVKAGDERVVKVSFPETYGVKELAGKPAEFDVKVGKVEAGKAAAIDDDFAKKIGFESLDKLKDTLRERIGAEYGQMTAMKLKRDVLDGLDKLYSFELPEKLVEAEFNSIWGALMQEMARAKKTFADENTTEDDARKEYRGIAERRVRLGLVLGTLGEKEGVNVNEQELQQALLNRMRQFPGQEKQVMEHYRKNPGALIELRGPIFEQKVVDLIVGKAKVSDKTVSREELQSMVSDEDENDSVAHHQAHDHDHDHDHGHEGHDHDHDHHAHDHHHEDHKHNHDHAKASSGAQTANVKPHKTSPPASKG